MSVTVSNLHDVNRHSSSFKMATVLEQWTKGEVFDGLFQCYKEHGKAFSHRIVIGVDTLVFHYIPESKAE
jgi:hypothetical protein